MLKSTWLCFFCGHTAVYYNCSKNIIQF